MTTKSDNSLSREQAEAAARASGYTGVWPPPPKPRVDGIEDFKRVLADVVGGDRRANLVSQLAVHAGRFFEQLPPERLRQMARTLIDTAHGTGTARRVRLAAVKAAIRPILGMIDRIKKLRHTRAIKGSMLAQLEESVGAFIDEFARVDPVSGQTELVRFAELLFTLATDNVSPAGRGDQVRAIDTATTLIMGMMDLIADAQAGGRASAAPEVDESQLAAARAQLKRIEAEIAGELRREPKPVAVEVN